MTRAIQNLLSPVRHRMAPARRRRVPADGRAAARVLQPAAVLRPGTPRGFGQVAARVIGSAADLRVATWNIRAAIGPGEPFPPAWWRHVSRDRLERIAGIIAELDARRRRPPGGRAPHAERRSARPAGRPGATDRDARALRRGPRLRARRARERPGDRRRDVGQRDPVARGRWRMASRSGLPGRRRRRRWSSRPAVRCRWPASRSRTRRTGPASHAAPSVGVWLRPGLRVGIVSAHLTYAGTEQRRAQVEAMAAAADGMGDAGHRGRRLQRADRGARDGGGRRRVRRRIRGRRHPGRRSAARVVRLRTGSTTC